MNGLVDNLSIEAKLSTLKVVSEKPEGVLFFKNRFKYYSNEKLWLFLRR
jgi:hypothetical protein